VWTEELGEGKTEWRGRLYSVATGQVRHFREWDMLLVYVRELLEQPTSGLPKKGEKPDSDIP
jgi:hypothetical protein